MAGFNSAINASLSSMSESAAQTGLISGNVANTDTGSYKRAEAYNQSLVSSSSSSAGGVSSTTRQLIDQQGEMTRTGIGTDLAIEGAGFVIVTDGFDANGKPRDLYVTRDLSFRKDQTNRLVNTCGYYLMAWGLDAEGDLPDTKSLVTSLESVNVAQLVAEASATTSVQFGANFRSEESVVGGGVKTINIISKGSNSSPLNAYIGQNEIIYPNAAHSLTKGEGIELTVGKAGDSTIRDTKKILYGGFCETLAFANTGTGLTTAVGGQLSTDAISIQYGSESLTVTRGAGATNLDVLKNIATQINENTPDTNGVRAKVINVGGITKLLIAPTNINQSVTFGGSLTFRNAIGLDDTKNIPSFSPSSDGVIVGRFATMKQFADALSSAGLTTTVNYNESVGTNITIQATDPVAFNNYQPLGKGSDFLAEFGLAKGYMQSNYDPYNAAKNIAGGTFNAHFSQNITIYDSMGNQHNLMLAFIKKDVNKWGVEVYATDKQAVDIPGRTDGLLMAGVVTFDGKGHFESIQKITQYSSSKELTSPEVGLGCTAGQTMSVTVGAITHTFTYGPMIAKSGTVLLAGTTLVGTDTDTLDITVGTSTYNIQRGTGATDLEVLQNIRSQINATTGTEAIYSDILYDSTTLQYHLNIRPADSTLAVSFAQTGTLGTDLGITSANDIPANSFGSLYELAEQMNATQGPSAVTAEVVPGDTKGTYKIRIQPVNSNFYLSFTGSSAAIGSPLGTGAADTIPNALGLTSTSSASQLKGLDEPLVINWSNTIGAEPNIISIGFGSLGGTDGLGQVSGNYSVKKANQNGVSTGNLTGIEIDPEGWITAAFSNSMTRKIYKIPVAGFANPNGLSALPGNVYMLSKDSGPLNLKEAGIDGAGKFVSGALEGSNVDIATELAKLIFAQRQYQSSAKVINVVDKMLEELMHRTFS